MRHRFNSDNVVAVCVFVGLVTGAVLLSLLCPRTIDIDKALKTELNKKASLVEVHATQKEINVLKQQLVEQNTLINELQIENKVSKVPVLEKLETVDSINERLLTLEAYIKQLSTFEDSARAVFNIQNFDINKLTNEIDTLKKQVNELSKTERGIIKKRVYWRHKLFCR